MAGALPSGSEAVGLPWLVLVAFIRLTTHPRFFPTPLETTTALEFVTGWLAQPCVRPIEPG